ncbi:enoyl-CoA hydratase [Pseudomonas knackmussii B13]|uniref:Enoyl-CoA hydratase n=1 Tax=Pseudomonas knackmussii (strain DSM 6978 / CCUG 54928 / LMG 23759 / B13) TaxID=1301098 RepID=A0A024HIY8_PSEKB|nr:enoyl-CoA hydratase [Pseudomonas knackmussii B13]
MKPASENRITSEHRGHLLVLGLNRAEKRNAFDQRMLDELVLALGEYERDPNLRCALLIAHGEHFTAGLDLADVGERFRKGWQLPAGAVDPWGTFGGPRLSKPLMVAAQGYCFTIGIELMLAADICLCASNARFAQMEVRRGLFPFGGATLRLPQTAGWGNAMRWLLTGDEFDAHEAYRLGLVQEIWAPEELLPNALKTRRPRREPSPSGGRSNPRFGTSGTGGKPGCCGREHPCQGAGADGQRRCRRRAESHAGKARRELQRQLDKQIEATFAAH